MMCQQMGKIEDIAEKLVEYRCLANISMKNVKKLQKIDQTIYRYHLSCQSSPTPDILTKINDISQYFHPWL